MFYKIQGLIYRKNKVTSGNIFNELIKFINTLPNWSEKPKLWFIATPKGSVKGIENGQTSQDALSYVDEMIKSNNSISVILADENEDDSILTLWFKNTPAISEDRYTFSLTIKSLSKLNDFNVFLDIFNKLTSLDEWKFKYIFLDTEQYRRKELSVFEDRLAVGWILFLPQLISSEHARSAFKVIQRKEINGTIIISSEIFDGKNPLHISHANNVEIELAADGFLPLLKGL